MDEIRKERLVVAIATLAGISCILQNYFGNWEFWVPGVVLIGGIVMWWVHLAQRLDSRGRYILAFVYSAFLAFYHGIHETSLYDVSIAVALLMVTFTMADNKLLLNLAMTEYGLIMCIQLWFVYQNQEFDLNAFEIMRIVFHIGTMLTLFYYCRSTVSGRLRERARIAKWQESVSENDRDMEDFLSNVSHELRTPVNVISGMTAILQKNNDCSELESIREAGVRLAHQIEDIQDYTEIKRGELVLENENYMCISLINDVVANHNASYKDSGLELIIDLDPKTPTMLYGDIKKLHKIFRLLVDNAMKFTKRGGVYIKIFPIAQEYGVNLTIEITDTGIGMTRAGMARVSKGMYQANKKRNRSTGGIGIGLPIVYGFVHKMGGFVMINSERGAGTTVRISVPQKVVNPTPCLSVKRDTKDGLVFYIKPGKYKVPEVREFNRSMAVNLATGLKVRLYSASETRELESVIKNYSITHIFTGQEEYEADKEVLNRLASEGYKVVVSANPGFKTDPGSGVIVMPKPLYAFPVVRILNNEETEDKAAPGEIGKVRFTGVSALVVDDEPMNLVVASGLLREYRMYADTVESGKAALAKYEEGNYDVIFMDHMMPEMDGVETMKRIRQIAAEKGRNPIIIALTANALSTAREMFAREGFDGFIAKPIDIEVFERVMKSVLPEEMIHYEGRD